MILTVNLLLQLDKPTGDKTTLGKQKRLVEKSCQHQFFNSPGLPPTAWFWRPTVSHVSISFELIGLKVGRPQRPWGSNLGQSF